MARLHVSNWRRPFDRPVYLRDGVAIVTLAQARDWLITMDSDRNEFQWAAGKLMAAAKGGSVAKAREAVVNAAVLNMKLDFERE